jgi:hypothetical protein
MKAVEIKITIFVRMALLCRGENISRSRSPVNLFHARFELDKAAENHSYTNDSE